MSYAVKEIFYTLQGEGMNAGRAAVFLRFAGCNLWTGREEDRARGSGGCSQWCDTNFVGTDGAGGGKFASAQGLARAAAQHWPAESDGERFIVCTGGEPLLQLDAALVDALHAEDFEIAIETNGTKPVPPGVDWICVSPKAGAELVVKAGDEFEPVIPQAGMDPAQFESLDFRHLLVSPLDNADRPKNTALAVEWCRAHPRWRLSLQTHKFLGIP